MRKILNLSTLQPNAIVRLIPVDGKCYGNPACFCIVKSVRKIPKKELIGQYTFERHKKALVKNNYNYTQLDLIQFSADKGSWSMRVPTKKSVSFLSLNDTDYEFELEEASLSAVKAAIAEAESAEIAEIDKSAEKQKGAVKQTYGNILTSALERLIES